MAVVRITEAWMRSLPPGSGQFTDATLPGFMLVSGAQRATWYAQCLVRGGRQTKYRVGHWPDISQVEARRRAAEILAAMRRGEDPREAERAKRARATTLDQALDLHLGGRRRSPRTEEGYRYAVEHYLGDWRRRTVEEISRDRIGVRERHRRIAQRHGRAAADSVMRVLRAVYNRARREHPDLPANPCENIDFHGPRRRAVDLAPERLRAWGEAVLRLKPVRRDLHLFMILTGMRRTAACEARVEHLDLGRDFLRVPNPKGGEARAFELPLSPPLIDLLRGRAGNRTTGWLFPSIRWGIHIADVRDDEPVIQGDQWVEYADGDGETRRVTITKYSDRLLEVLLKFRYGDQLADRVRVTTEMPLGLEPEILLRMEPTDRRVLLGLLQKYASLARPEPMRAALEHVP